ncbi:MAG TPA: contractile injection system protein, VgrG/Pvc8 family [Polyangia bacterium]|nr:contractile injection system protein, VgrG/Pvc8 family [Polyangia bacterium]
MAEQALSTAPTYHARPTVRVDGQDNTEVTAAMLTMRMVEQEGGLCSLELRLANFGGSSGGPELLFDDEQAVKLGSELAIYSGDVETPQEIFRGVVTGFESEFPEGEPPELVLLAEDKLQQARLTRRTKTHDNLKLSDLASSVASSMGLTGKATGLTDDLGTQVQLNESDLAFLRRLLARYDGDLQVVGDELQVSPRGEVKRSEVELELYSQLRRVRVTADLAHQVTETSCTGWDEVKGSKIKATSKGVNSGPGAGRTGASILTDAIGERSEHVGHLVATTRAEAQAIADSDFDRRARRFVIVDGTCEGNPKVRVGTHVTLKSVSTRFDNTYYVVRAVHRFDQRSGYVTDFEAEGAWLGNP